MTNRTKSSPASSLQPAVASPAVKRSGPLRALFALRHSCDGIVETLRNESAFRQEAVLAAILVPVALIVPVDALARVLLIASVLLVLLVELLNSAIEAVVDRVSLEHHELSKRAKDCGSAAVTIALLICALTWGMLCGPLAYHWLRG